MQDSGKAGFEVPIKNQAVYTVTCTVADTEYPQELPAGIKYFTMQPRQNADVRFASETGKVAGPVEPYGTMKSGAPHDSPKLELIAPITIYFASSEAGTVVEIIAWR